MRRPTQLFPLFAATALVLLASCTAARQTNKLLNDWPTDASPAAVGKRVVENFVVRQFDYQTNPRRQYVIYPEVCTWYGSLTVAELTGDSDLKERLIRKFDPLLSTDAARISPNAHVDYRVFGAVPLQIYMLTKERRYLDLGVGLADKQWDKPSEDGVTGEARYWIDDMYMISAVQAQAFRATGDPKYLDRAALTMAAYLDKLQQPNGLFHHSLDSPFHWGRGNGWVAAGMTELLRSLPPNHPRRARILEGYRKMMAALLKYQGEDGLWRQLIDHPEAWSETSGTGMFTFAIVTGVKNGWLDSRLYGQAGRNAWLGLIKHIDQDGNVSDVCVGTDKKNDLQYYLTRPRRTGDLHGQAPVLWTVSALLR